MFTQGPQSPNKKKKKLKKKKKKALSLFLSLVLSLPSIDSNKEIKEKMDEWKGAMRIKSRTDLLLPLPILLYSDPQSAFLPFFPLIDDVIESDVSRGSRVGQVDEGGGGG